MELVTAKSAGDIEAFFDRFSTGFLFRGQTAFYLDGDGKVSIPTSFERHGCVPPTMLKWSRYASEMLRVFNGGHDHDLPIEVPQALLQHYGWRSFYIDLTRRSDVASWFASMKFMQSIEVHVAEDCDGASLMCGVRSASYEPWLESGYVFAVDQSVLEHVEGAKVVDLVATISADFPTRFSAQEALLFGPCERLPHECIVACLKAPAALLSGYSASNSAMSVLDLFPPRGQDFFLSGLLSTPFIERGRVDESLPVFGRDLDLPEYDVEFTKRHPQSIAFYSPVWVADKAGFGLREDEVCHIKVADFVLYGSGRGATEDLSPLLGMIGSAKMAVIEASGLLRHIESFRGTTYLKGVVLSFVSTDVVCVSELIVDHPGCSIAGMGIEMGVHYRVRSGRLERLESDEDCTCNNPFKHELHLNVLKLVSDQVSRGFIKQSESGAFLHDELVGEVIPAVQWAQAD